MRKNKQKIDSTITMDTELFGKIVTHIPAPEPHKWFCATCRKLIEGPIYCDGGFMEVNHGGGQCKECYLKSGHRECSCGAFLTENMNFCHQCGKAKNDFIP